MSALQVFSNQNEKRILLLAPTGRDAQLISTFLSREGLCVCECRDIPHLCDELIAGAGALVIAEESLDSVRTHCLLETVDRQPPWSDIPILLFPTSDRSSESLISTLGRRANVTIFERPLRTIVLVSAVHSALRARDRQYQMRDLLHRLEETDRQKDTFLAMLSHELRTPLTSIVGWIHLLKLGKLDGDAFFRAVDSMERNTAAQIRLVEDILSVSKLVAGKLDIERQPLRLADIVVECVETFRLAAAGKRLRLHVDVTCADCVLGDSVRLQEVIWNLLSNAIKFTPPEGEIHVSLVRETGILRLRVTDTGTGISATLLPHIFEHFRQADSSNRRAAGGLGLGLAIARKLVELHGGTIRAESAGQNQGTSMVVELPVHEVRPDTMDSRHTDHASERHDDPLRGFVVLLVEDDPDSRELLAYILRSSGADVLAAETAREALELFRHGKPNLIVSDIGLAGENGYELLQKIRREEQKSGTATPAVALTGFADPQSQQQALSAGYQLHMAKPIQPDTFITTVAKLVSAHP